MIVQTMTKMKAKPFLKWAGGKTQLLPTIDSFLPNTFRGEDDVTSVSYTHLTLPTTSRV